MMICTIVCLITISGSMNAQSFVMKGATTPTATLTNSDPDENDTICVGDDIFFSAATQAGSTYQFYVNGSVTQGPGNNNTYIPASAFTAGEQEVILRVDNGTCSATDTIDFVTLALPVPTLTVPDNSVCAGTLVTFTAGGGINYNFMVNGATVQNSANNIYSTSTLTNGQEITVEVTNAGGCSMTSTGITMTIFALPTATLTTPDNSVCAESSVTFIATGGVNYDFKIDGTSVQNSSIPTYTTTALTDDQIVTVDVTNGNGCVMPSNNIPMTIFPLPYATSVTGNQNPECVGNFANVTITGLVGAAPWSFEIWNTSTQSGTPTTLYYTVPTNSTTNNTNISVPVPAVGMSNMFLRVTDNNGCSNY